MTNTAPRGHITTRLVALVGLVVLFVGCVPTGERPELVDEHLGDLDAADCPSPGEPFAAFGAAEVTVVGPGGVATRRCVLVAATAELRQRGLMEVADLAGYDGMLFSFPEDTSGSFWMSNTHLPLTIAFVDRDGGVVSTVDMDPCPDGVDCPFYGPDGPYRWALEVPQGNLADLGLVEGAHLDPDSLPLARPAEQLPGVVEE